MKKIYLDTAGRIHSLYKGLVLYPPPGYKFITQKTHWDKVSNMAIGSNSIYAFQERVLSKVIPVNMAKAYLEKFKKPPAGTALTYATGHLVFRKETWVVDLEFATQLAGYSINHFRRYRRLIERHLASKYCKKIICWTEAARRTLINNMDCLGFKDKIEVIPLAVPRKDFIKKYGATEKIKLLFVGSGNIDGEFIYKGGLILLESFRVLSKKYENIELIIRSDIPHRVKQEYGRIENIRLIEGLIPWEQLEDIFKSADIFLFPTHSTPGLAILDAMSYELPVVATSVWANPEMVADGVTGLLINESRHVPYYVDDFIPNWNYLPGSPFMKAIESVDPVMVDELVEKTSILIENEGLRRTMGQAGRKLIESGLFSIEKRNEKLKIALDEATAGGATKG